MPLPKSAEHQRLEGVAAEFPAGTRKGDDARAKLADIVRNRAREEQRQEGKGQFVQATKTRPGLRIKAQARPRR